MATISSNELKSGMTLMFRGVLHQVVQAQHIKPGKGGAFVRTKLRNLQTGAIIDYNFRAKESVEQAFVEKKPREYLYRDGAHFYVMDPETYEQAPISGELMAGKEQFLKENTELLVTFHGSEIIDVQLPDSVVLEVVQAPPGIKGDTATGGTKPVTLETGAVIQAPLFVNQGDKVRVDTRTGQYLERA